MADAEEEFSSDAVLKFLLHNGGRATNIEVVGHFAKYLNDQEKKVLNRQKFKDYINEVATVKTEKGEKYLVLKNEYFYKEWIEPKHVIIRSAQSQAPKASWPPPAEQPKEKEPDPVPPARRKKKSHHDQNGSSEAGKGSSSGAKTKGGGSPRPTISAPIYTGPVEQKSVVSTVAGEKVIEELSQIEGVKDAKEIFEQESRLQAPSPMVKPQTSSPSPSSSSSQPQASTPPSTSDSAPTPTPSEGLASVVAPAAAVAATAAVQIQITDEDAKETEPKEEEAATAMEGVQEGGEKAEPEKAESEQGAEAATHSRPVSTITLVEKLDESPSVKMAAKMFESQAEKEAASMTPKLGVKRTNLDHSLRSHHDDDDHMLISSDLAGSASTDTLRSIKSTSSGNSFPESRPQLEPLEKRWMMESAKANIPVLLELLDQEPGLIGKKDFITGFSALHWGAKHGKKEMIRLVADRGIDINMRSQGGYTPLHIAAMHNKEAIMQFLVTEYHADIDKRDYSGRKPRHYLQSAASNYIKQMMHGQSTAEVIKPHNLMSLAEPKQEETKRHSRLGSILRSSFRNSFRLWGSAENLEDKDHKRDRTPPVTPPPSPKTRPKSAHNLSYTQSLLMPPPSGYTVPNRSRKLRSTSDKNREDQIRRFDSDPDMLTESTTATFV